ncbi:MAG TPA: urate hydroxylase PuuD [Candidatus Angelobacter sp.]|nr:urate hydroxylase PuuD [Candidatus Angelobacter sp.]
MPQSLLLILTPPQIEFLGGGILALMLLRWIHTIAGILWVGLLYYLVLINAPFLSQLDPQTRTAVVPKLMPKALWWFRWSSVVTVLAGIAYWMHIVGTDVRNAVASGQPASGAMITGSFFLIWTLAFAVEMGALMSPAEFLRKGAVFGVLVAIIVLAASYVFLSLNQHGWESNRALTIGIGGGLGWFMMMNVWGIVWRMQKKIIRWTEAVARGEAMPAEYAKTARLAFLTSRVNFWLSLPMLFFMGAASHYVLFASQ